MDDANACHSHPGWTVGPSMALELDAAISLINGSIPAEILTKETAHLVEALPADWRDEYLSFFGEVTGFHSIIEPGAILAGVLLEEDYDRVTLPVREISLDEALERAARDCRPLGIEPDLALPPMQRLAELRVRWSMATFRSIGFEFTQSSQMVNHMRVETEQAVRILKGGDLHGRFWHWLDRYYYQIYQPWRAGREAVMKALADHAAALLGGAHGRGIPPQTSWLPAQCPLLRHPELQLAVSDGRLDVFFWVEPFGLSDSWSLLPGRLIISFAEPGELYENFFALSKRLAGQVQALADPTRLVILRLIRYLGMTNTDMAAYLGLARPTVSIHARILREAGLIHTRADGRAVRHEIDPAALRRLFSDLESYLGLSDEGTGHSDE